MHLLERISVDFQVQNSIVPTALNLARFKVSGKLPSLQVNLSDTKYKSLMRLIDVCIPNFGDDVAPRPPPLTRQSSTGFHLQSGLFGQSDSEYHIEEEEDQDDDLDPSASQEDLFVDAEDGTVDVSIISLLKIWFRSLYFSSDRSCINMYSSSPSRWTFSRRRCRRRAPMVSTGCWAM